MPAESATPQAPDNIDQATDHILGLLGPDEGDPAAEESKTDPSGTTDGDTVEAEETEETGDPGKQAQEPQKFRVKVNGEEIEVTQDELTSGYSRLQDYKAKTAEVARQREAIEAERGRISAERQRYADQLGAILQQAQMFDPVLAEGSRTDWAKLAQDDLPTYHQKWAAYQQRLGTLNAVAQAHEQARNLSLQEHFAAEEKALLEAIPEFADKEVASKEIASLKDWAVKTYGFDPQHLAVINNHRNVLIARDAKRYHDLLAKQKAVATKKVVNVPKVQQPGSSEGRDGRSPRIEALKKRASRTGRIDDQAAAVLAALDEG